MSVSFLQMNLRQRQPSVDKSMSPTTSANEDSNLYSPPTMKYPFTSRPGNQMGFCFTQVLYDCLLRSEMDEESKERNLYFMALNMVIL